MGENILIRYRHLFIENRIQVGAHMINKESHVEPIEHLHTYTHTDPYVIDNHIISVAAASAIMIASDYTCLLSLIMFDNFITELNKLCLTSFNLLNKLTFC